jgi:hypothetical protein
MQKDDERSPSQAVKLPDRDPQVFYELARERLAVQLDSIDAVDNKIGLLFSTSSALLGILAAVFALRSNGLGLAEYVLLGASVAVYLLISWKSADAYRARAWHVGPDLKQVWKEYRKPGDDRLLQWEIANHLRLDYEANQPAANTKHAALDLLLPAVVSQSLILVLALVLVSAGA